MLNLPLSQEEIHSLAMLLDVAVKATGIEGAKKALPLMAKLEQAVAEANAPKQEMGE